MRNIFLLIGVALLVAGCGTTPPPPPSPVLLAPQDNLLVDCDVQPPPPKEVFLKDYTVGVVPTPLLKDNLYYLNLYVAAVQGAQARETLLTDLVLKGYENVDVCNQRWAKLREWKANAVKALQKD